MSEAKEESPVREVKEHPRKGKGEPRWIVDGREQRRLITEEVQKEIKAISEGGNHEVKLLAQMLHGPLLALRVATLSLEGSSRGRGKTTDFMSAISESSALCWRIFDRLKMAQAGQSPGGETLPSLKEYMAQKEAKTQATLSRKKSGRESTVGKGTGRTERARFPDTGET